MLLDELQKNAEQALLEYERMTEHSLQTTALFKAVVNVFQYAKAVNQKTPVWNLSVDPSCKQLDNWIASTPRPAPQPGEIYKHFKGKCYEIISGAAVNCTNDTNSQNLVVYQSVDSGDVWVRSYDEFMSAVDKMKYPGAQQYWRFEKI